MRLSHLLTDLLSSAPCTEGTIALPLLAEALEFIGFIGLIETKEGLEFLSICEFEFEFERGTL